MQKIILFALLLLSSTTIYAGHTIDAYFISAPAQLIPQLDENRRKDLIDFHNAGVAHHIVNQLGGEVLIDTIDDIRGTDRQLYVVVGCGGTRDRTKRPEMARIAADGADLAVLTSDNPRKEDPEAILAEMKAGLDASSRYLCIADRREAIKAAVALARPGDIVLVAGKGHETYQDVGGVKHHFDDREEVRRAMGLE